MNETQFIEGGHRLDGEARFGVIVSRFNSFIVDCLLKGCLDTLAQQGVAPGRVTVVRVPGAYEIPVTALRMAVRGGFDALIALGAVIRGDTPHFEYVAGECARGVTQVSVEHGLPIVFGVLTTDTVQQAAERAGGKAGNKGAEAALTAIEMVNVLRGLER